MRAIELTEEEIELIVKGLEISAVIDVGYDYTKTEMDLKIYYSLMKKLEMPAIGIDKVKALISAGGAIAI